MAVLAYELVALTSADGRETLLDQDQLDAGTLDIPDEIASRWPAGWSLVKCAFEATRPELAPSPQDWIGAIESAFLVRSGVRVHQPEPDVLGSVQVQIVQPDGAERRVNLRTRRNSFAKVHRDLSWLWYERDGDQLRLEGSPPGSYALSLRGSLITRQGPFRVNLDPGDSIHTAGFDITRD
jgi:hypothetical protein